MEGCLFYDIGVLDLLGGYMGEYLGVGAGWQDIVRVLLLGNLRELVFPDRFLGGRGWLRSWLIFPVFFSVFNLPFGFTVPWVEDGLAAAWFHLYILIFCFLPVLIFYGLHLGYGYGGKGGTFRIFCYGSLGCSEASFIAHTAAYLCVLGLAGLGWQSILGTLGSGRAQSVVVCLVSRRPVF